MANSTYTPRKIYFQLILFYLTRGLSKAGVRSCLLCESRVKSRISSKFTSVSVELRLARELLDSEMLKHTP